MELDVFNLARHKVLSIRHSEGARIVAGRKRRWRQVVGGVLATAVVAIASNGALSQNNALGSANEGEAGPDLTEQPESANLIWYKSAHRTQDGQSIMPWKEFLRTWEMTCDEWTGNETRRVVIFTAFAPDVLMMQTPGRDAAQEGTWSVEKMYSIDPRDLHIHGDRQKSIVVHIDVGRDRPRGLIMHEERNASGNWPVCLDY